MIHFRSAAALVVTLTTAALAAPTDSPMAPVAGGLSGRLAPLGSFLETQPTDFRANLASQLEQARTQTHELIDRIVDEDGLAEFLEAMSDEGEAESELAKSLASADVETARAVLHSKVERQLAEFGRTIQKGLTDEDPTRLRASFDLAMRDLAREENHLMQTLEPTGPSAPVASDLGLDHEELDEPPSTEGPSAPVSMGPAAPEGRRGDRGQRGGGRGQRGDRGMRNGGRSHRGGGGRQVQHTQRQVRRTQRQVHQTRRQVHQTRRQVHQTQAQLRQTQRQLARTQNRMRQVQQQQMYRSQRRDVRRHQRRTQRRMDRVRRDRRAYQHAQRSAWLTNQARAAAWNARAQGYPTYGYRPGYQRRYSRPFPTGYYYRPDRVERVVRRGLWGVATVAATPFALLASVF